VHCSASIFGALHFLVEILPGVPSDSAQVTRTATTSNRMHGEFLRLPFLQAHRETEAHFTATGMPSQRNQSESFRFKHSAFYQGLKSRVGLAAAKAVALRINLNVQGCSIVAAPMHAPSRTSLLSPPPSFTQSPAPPRSLVRDGQTSPHRPRLVVSPSTCPPTFGAAPPRKQICTRSCSNKHTHTLSECSPPPACDNADTLSECSRQSCAWGHVNVGWCMWGRETGGILYWLCGGQGAPSDSDS
jgi:hypothetical protein